MNRSIIKSAVCGIVIFGLFAGAFAADVKAVSGKSSTGQETEAGAAGETVTAASETVTTQPSDGVDEKGNAILMTQSQKRSRFRSKTNPKRGEKVVTPAYKPNFNGFTYADFGTCNSYNSENGLGGSPVYLLGTIMGIEKVYENALYYGTAILVNDCDGYQWYMRADIAKDKYDLFKNSFLGKSGYIYGRYAGYSGVTDRPMIDVAVLQPDGTVPYDLRLYR